MSFDWTQVVGVVVVLMGAAFLYLQYRHGPRATAGLESSTDLQRRIHESSFTLVQLFAPL